MVASARCRVAKPPAGKDTTVGVFFLNLPESERTAVRFLDMLRGVLASTDEEIANRVGCRITPPAKPTYGTFRRRTVSPFGPTDFDAPHIATGEVNRKPSTSISRIENSRENQRHRSNPNTSGSDLLPAAGTLRE